MPSDFSFETIPAGGLAQRWRAAWAVSDASPFLSWSWISAWSAAAPAPPILLRARRAGGEALGFLCRAPDTGRRRVFALNECGDRALDVAFIEHNGLAGWMPGPLEVEDLGRFLVRSRRHGPIAGWDEIQFGGVPRFWGDAFAAAGLWVWCRSCQPSFAVDLAALRSGGGDALSSLGASTRRQIRRSIDLYAAQGELRLEPASDAASWHDALACLRDLHQARWQAVGKPGAFASPVFRDFVDRLAARAVRTGEAELLRVRCGAATIGVLFNLVGGGRVASYLSGFVAERDNRLKPGLVSHALAIDHHLARGARVYDLLAGDARYKRSLASPSGDLAWLVVRPNGLSALRAASRRALERWRMMARDDVPLSPR